jgi:pyrimidine deaminase RibD-like protein
MSDEDLGFMSGAIDWAEGCKPKFERIPKVGAIIVAKGGKVIGRGRRGTGIEGDDKHAEREAIYGVKDKTELPESTMFTTLEPCTPEVRANKDECCTELILRHRIKRVVIGILDPNQGVRGKGIWQLQTEGVEVELFPHALAEKIRAANAPFILSQEILGAEIISPENGEILKTYETRGRHPIRFTCVNPPGPNNHLLAFQEGLCWPQLTQFRQVADAGNTWEIDAHFGTTGDYTLSIVESNELGKLLVDYYAQVLNENVMRRDHLKGKLNDPDAKVLANTHIGIPMTRLPKGLRLEASVKVTIADPKGKQQ